MEYLSRVPRPPLDQLVDDFYYLEGPAPYPRLKLPPMPSAVLILNLGDRFVIDTSGTRPAEFADGCLLTTGTRHFEFGYPPVTRSVGVHFKPWGWAPFVGIPGAEVCDLQLTVQQVWGRYGDELRDRLDAAATPERMLGLLEAELRRRFVDVPGLELVRQVSGRIAAASGAVSIGPLCADAGVSSTHLADRFKRIVGITPKRLARTYRFARVVRSLDAAATVDWGALACRAGYFDQSHFVKDFRTFTGCTPTAYLALRRRFLVEHPGNALDVGPLPAG
ncbi:helix-turn-helix domain-containing protein [Plantactinospora sp. WMMB782]|uniref:helix-turn-helix domain-containing protein n=1 Tax=Plantactinospora sp. WMMB782 TaxID=3404121 RepID=UPI003B936AA5